jgi:hypothetical protein
VERAAARVIGASHSSRLRATMAFEPTMCSWGVIILRRIAANPFGFAQTGPCGPPADIKLGRPAIYELPDPQKRARRLGRANW